MNCLLTKNEAFESNSLFGWRESRWEQSRDRESKLNYLVWMFFKGEEGEILKGF